LALATESLQAYIYKIRFEWHDLATDIFAVLIGSLLFFAIPYLRPKSF